MSALQTVDQEWQNWVDENIQRGCDPVEIFKITRKNGFNTAMIKHMMGNHYPEGIELDEPKSPIDYLALSKPPIGANNPQLVVKQFPTELIQLYTIENFLTVEECEGLMAISEQHLRPSEVTHNNGDNYFRTSETCDFLSVQDELIRKIDDKISKTLGIRLAYSEPIQVQRYLVGQEFKPHHDYFAPDADIYAKFAGEMGQRTWTFMVYLNNTPRGGGTNFVHLEQTFYPKQGMAVIWNNLHTDGTPNRHTLHHGMPVEEGKKIIITKWFREKGYGSFFYEQTTNTTQTAKASTAMKLVLPDLNKIKQAKLNRQQKRRHKAKRK